MSTVNGRCDGPGGRDPGGRFGPGNAFSKGNANNKRMHELRRVLLDATTEDMIRKALAKLADLAEAGDVQAIKLLIDQTCGRAPQAVELSTDGATLILGERIDYTRVLSIDEMRVFLRVDRLVQVGGANDVADADWGTYGRANAKIAQHQRELRQLGATIEQDDEP
jgi:hypothetical protein